ncbi:hypothetical protein Kisp01_64350 [Kineosporia sp. NBRC 101677]|nr:hypothetical protein Kisp01_64350 [Kineosporia sp. NBRC 101677]
MGAAGLGSAALVPVLLAGPAHAEGSMAHAEVVGAGGKHYQLNYFSGSGLHQQLKLSVEKSADQATFVYTLDDTAQILTGDHCSYPDNADLTRVTCVLDNTLGDSSSANDPIGQVSLADGNDAVTFTNHTDVQFTHIHLGGGNNSYTTGQSAAQDADVDSDDGTDTITAGTGASVSSGGGRDILTFTGGAAQAWAGDGNDEIQGGPGDDRLDGGAGDDIIYGNDGDDHITGAQGNDMLYGGRQNDTMYGNSGDDVIYGNSGDDYISGGPGEDTLSGGTGTNTVIP